MASIHREYIAAGGNRHPAAADWAGNLLAYGSGKNIALWRPLDGDSAGTRILLSGHNDAVNAVRLVPSSQSPYPVIISGSADKTVRIWCCTSEDGTSYLERECLTEHQGSVNTIATLPGGNVFVTGGADATLKVWKFAVANTNDDGIGAQLPDGKIFSVGTIPCL